MAMCAPLVRLPAKSASFPKATHRCHSVRDSQDPASFFQDVLVASEKIAMLVELAAFLSASLPMKPIRVIRVRYIRFSLFCPFVSGTGKRVGAAPKSRSCFSGGTGTGEPEPEGCGSKAEASQTPGAAKAPKQWRDNEQYRKLDQTDHHFAGRSRSNAVIQNHPRYASAVQEVNDGVPGAETANAWGGNWDTRRNPHRTARRRHTPARMRPPRSHRGKQPKSTESAEVKSGR